MRSFLVLMVMLAAGAAACAQGADASTISGAASGSGSSSGSGSATPDGGSSSGDPSQYPDVKAFCNAYAQAVCTQAVVSACGAKNSYSCELGAAAACIANQPQGTTYVAKNAPACIQLTQQVYASTTITVKQLDELATTCGTQIFSGPGMARDACATDYDCSSADGLVCVIPYGSTTNMGKCYAPTTVQPGGSCTAESAVCTDGYFCDPMAQTCSLDGAMGQGCNPGWKPCGDGLTCQGAGSPFAACGALAPDGNPCTLDTDCAGGLCDKAAMQSQGTCASQITLSPLDKACASLSGQ
jgi:hypothetical protein